ncbi:hypothetical protein [Paracoccus yeei]|uniref:Restriction alleviation protein, Lar family n=1 Tax=Paracoccus yeei TaxID=147645 RepID=A0A2D2C419_9RHOB|nr:hypothetical protein [Paracoccus yeei]ATQ57245.1 hypothetical protein PYTT13_16535 [Paracoccus yeei]
MPDPTDPRAVADDPSSIVQQMPKVSTEVLPCPFCGWGPEIGYGDAQGLIVACCITEGCPGEKAVAPVQEWNRRATEADLRAEVERRPGLSKAAQDVMAERQRQISVEGWTPEHDDAHDECELAFAAAVYALESAWPSNWQDRQRQGAIRELWPWQAGWHKSTTQRRDLVKVGALILADIERLDRAALSPETDGGQDAPADS